MNINGAGMSDPRHPVVMNKAFEELDWGSTDLKTIEKHMQTAINEDPLIKDPSRISVSLSDSGGNKVFELIGKVNDENEKHRVEEIVRKNSRNTAEIKDSLVLEA
jgi:hypothetical protein